MIKENDHKDLTKYDGYTKNTVRLPTGTVINKSKYRLLTALIKARTETIVQLAERFTLKVEDVMSVYLKETRKKRKRKQKKRINTHRK